MLSFSLGIKDTYALTAFFGPVSLLLYAEGGEKELMDFLSSLSALNTYNKGGIVYFREDITSYKNKKVKVLLGKASYPEFYLEEEDSYVVKGPINEAAFHQQVHRVFYAIAERYGQSKHQQFTIHAAAVYLPHLNKGVLILGNKGGGKSSLAYALCSRFKARLIGNDLVIVGKDQLSGKLFLYGGVPEFKLRETISTHFFEELREQEFTPLITSPLQCERKSLWPTRNVHYEAVPLDLILRINLHEMTPETSIDRHFNKKIESLRLNELLARHIKAQTSVLYHSEAGEIQGYFPPLDTPLANEKRIDMIQRLLKEPFIYLESNSPIAAAKLVLEQLKES